MIGIVKDAIDCMVYNINKTFDSKVREMLSIYSEYNDKFTNEEILLFMKDKNIELKCDTERMNPSLTRRYYIYDNKLKTDVAAFYYEQNLTKLTIDISKVYFWPRDIDFTPGEAVSFIGRVTDILTSYNGDNLEKNNKVIFIRYSDLDAAIVKNFNRNYFKVNLSSIEKVG